MTKTILCLASYFKGTEFLVACKRAEATVLLMTRDKLRDAAWPHDSIDEIFYMPSLSTFPDIIYSVSYLARSRIIDQVIPLDDYDVLTAAELREHLRLPGMGATAARYVRDKLAMRQGAGDAGLPVPRFKHVLHHHQLYEFMRDVPGPWLLKPRGEAGAMGIKQINSYDDLWRWLEQLGDEQSNFLLEEFIIGDVYHVDSIVWDGEVIFAAPHQYGKPPIQVAHQGGVFMSRSLDPESNVGRALIVQNAAVLEALGMRQGVAHTEFIRSEVDGKYYFVETAGRVGGASISDLIEQASGINLWAEWCRLELAALQGVEYQLPTVREGYAGILVCLARQQYPDMSSYDDPEVVWRMQKEHHAGVIVRSDDPERVEALLERYAIRFGEDFLAVAPPLDKPPT